MQEDKCSFTYINKSKNNKYKKENVNYNDQSSISFQEFWLKLKIMKFKDILIRYITIISHTLLIFQIYYIFHRYP